jgi:hypothetical protein
MRHRLARFALAASIGCACVALAASRDAGAVRDGANPVATENARRGTGAWRLRDARRGEIAAYASQVSVTPGAMLELHVSAAAGRRYRVEVYRIGWYGGAGGRRVACSPSCTGDRGGVAYPVPPPDAASGLLRANWPVTDRVEAGSDWVSGYYLADVVLTGRPRRRGAWVPFVVLAPPGRSSAILVQAAVNTWQAYNRWGGRSLYWNHTGAGDDHVSFDRPYDARGAPHYGGRKANLPQAWEFPLARFLERSGYDVAYTTDVDTDRDPGELLRHRLVMTAGHDEYWTKTIRDAFESARGHGVNLAFMGANTGYWQMRYADDRRTIVEYRTGDRDPEPSTALKTVRFRDLVPARPECMLLGVESLVIGVGDYVPVVSTPLDPWFEGTSFTSSTVLKGLVGYEYDTIVEECKTPALTRLFHFSARNNPNADAVRYTARSGARVFSSGSVWFAAGLDPLDGRGDPRLQRFMRNAIIDLTRA